MKGLRRCPSDSQTKEVEAFYKAFNLPDNGSDDDDDNDDEGFEDKDFYD